MGLMDILNGMQNGPGGAPQPKAQSRGSGSSGGMSPLMMALLGLLAYNAVKARGGQAAAPGQPAQTPPGGTVTAGQGGGGGLDDILGGLFGGKPGGATPGGKPGGSLADMLPGGLGGLLGGAAAGSVLSGGL